MYRFSSKEIHVNSGLYYYGYRWDAPNLQRWLNRDPIAESGGMNLYRFVRNDSVDNNDALGLHPDGSPSIDSCLRLCSCTETCNSTSGGIITVSGPTLGIWMATLRVTYNCSGCGPYPPRQITRSVSWFFGLGISMPRPDLPTSYNLTHYYPCPPGS